jgi:hypothetical protein
MTSPSGGAADTGHWDTHHEKRQAVEELFRDSGLYVRQLLNGARITNPRDDEKGMMLIEYEDASIWWERTVIDHLGVLERLGGDEDEDEICARDIISTMQK